MNYNIDPELRYLVEALSESDLNDPAAAHAGMAKMTSGLNAKIDTAGLSVEDWDIPGYDSAQLVRVRVYAPEGQKRFGIRACR